MYPLIYQNIGGIESIYADQTILLATDATLTGPTAVRWYQFNMTGNTIPATPTQQQDWNNGADGLFRWMPSINVDWQGNVAIGYSTSSTTLNPEIRYAGRLAGDPPNDMAQGEATLITSGGHQTNNPGRWGDYSTMFVDPTDSCTFWHTNEYYTATSGAGWATRVGSFKFASCTNNADTNTDAATQRYTKPDTNCDSNSYSNSNSNSNCNSNTNSNSNTIPNSASFCRSGHNHGDSRNSLDRPTISSVALAFAAINAGIHQGDIIVWILGDTTEAAAGATLNASGSGSASYTSVAMLPSGARTVTGAITAGSPLINLNGAKNVSINGENVGGNSLTLSNTTASATAGTSTIRLINGAQNNIITNCTVLGSSTSAATIAGGNILISTSTGGANSGNFISNNNIGPAARTCRPRA